MDSYFRTTTVAATDTTTLALPSRVRTHLYIRNRGSIDIIFGFWANLAVSPVPGESSGCGILVPAGKDLHISMPAVLMGAQQELYIRTVSAGTSNVDIIDF